MKTFKEFIMEGSINVNTVMNRGPHIQKKRGRHGYSALSNHEKNILKQWENMMKGKKPEAE